MAIISKLPGAISGNRQRIKAVNHLGNHIATLQPGAQFEGDLGEILALGAEISPYIGLREKQLGTSVRKRYSISIQI